MKQSQRIVKNAVVGVAAGVIAGVVYLATTIAIARNHNVSLAEFGKYQWVPSLCDDRPARGRFRSAADDDS